MLLALTLEEERDWSINSNSHLTVNIVYLPVLNKISSKYSKQGLCLFLLLLFSFLIIFAYYLPNDTL